MPIYFKFQSGLKIAQSKSKALTFQFKIINEGKMIYTLDKNDSANFVEKTVNHYRDQKYFIDLFYQGILETVGN